MEAEAARRPPVGAALDDPIQREEEAEAEEEEEAEVAEAEAEAVGRSPVGAALDDRIRREVAEAEVAAHANRMAAKWAGPGCRWVRRDWATALGEESANPEELRPSRSSRRLAGGDGRAT